MAPAKILVQDPGPVGLPESLTVAVAHIPDPWTDSKSRSSLEH